MTRGKLVLITNTGVYSSCEFNGDMYPSGRGEAAVIALQGCSDVQSFGANVKRFGVRFFEYELDECDIYHILGSDAEINLVHDYFKHWFSDYLYFKNATDKDVEIKCKKKTSGSATPSTMSRIIRPGEVAWFHFGCFSGVIAPGVELEECADDASPDAVSKPEIEAMEQALESLKQTAAESIAVCKRMLAQANELENALDVMTDRLDRAEEDLQEMQSMLNSLHQWCSCKGAVLQEE